MISLRAAIFCWRNGNMADSFFFTVTGILNGVLEEVGDLAGSPEVGRVCWRAEPHLLRMLQARRSPESAAPLRLQLRRTRRAPPPPRIRHRS